MKILIFAGGNGTRLWPVSRVATPKQFQHLIGDTSLFRLTVDRINKEFPFEDIFIVVPEIYRTNVKQIAPEIPNENIIIEPCKWDTLACIGYAAMKIYAIAPKENIFLVWSDHIIKDETAFLATIKAGDMYATKQKKVIKIGAKATYPEVNWGYIEFGDQIDEIGKIKIYEFVSHHEKPEYQKAKKFVESFEYLWNMGYMIWPAEMLVQAYKTYVPEAFSILQEITEPAFSGNIIEKYKQIPKTSIDYAILEHADKNDFVVIPADVGWNDVGDWASLKTQLEVNEESIVSSGEIKKLFAIDTKNTIVYGSSKQKVICLIDLDDVAIVDTPDALLVCSKKHSKDVKKIVELLNEEMSEIC